jgi:hypothetical protein
MRRGRKWLLSNRSRNAAFIPAVAAIAAESARAHGKALQHAPAARGTRRRWQRRQRRLEGEERRLPRKAANVNDFGPPSETEAPRRRSPEGIASISATTALI